MARALFIAAFFFTMTPLLISVQWALGKLGLPGWGFIASNYYRVLCTLLRIRVRVNRRAGARPCRPLRLQSRVVGRYSRDRFACVRWPLLPNAKSRDWPLVGITAKLQRTVFVDRTRRHQTASAVAEMVKRLIDGISVVLFAEGTSSDGNRVLPFRSALIGAVRRRRAWRRCNSYSADVDQLHGTAGHPDGPSAPPAGRRGMVISISCHTSRHLSHTVRSMRSSVTAKQFPANGADRPQGHDQTPGKRSARPAGLDVARTATGRAKRASRLRIYFRRSRLSLKRVVKSKIWSVRDKSWPGG